MQNSGAMCRKWRQVTSWYRSDAAVELVLDAETGADVFVEAAAAAALETGVLMATGRRVVDIFRATTGVCSVDSWASDP
jgi:hypothetical protein